MKRWLVYGVALLVVAGTTVVHFLVTSLPLTEATPLLLLDHLWRLGLLIILLWLATSVGLAIATRLGVTFFASVEALPFTIALGYGAMMTVIAWLGFVRLFNLAAVVIVLVGLAWLSQREWPKTVELWRTMVAAPSRIMWGVSTITFPQVALAIIGLLLFVAAIPTLAPVDSNDALMYHLPAVASFIEAGQIVPFPLEVQPNYPLGFEMLYAVGLMLQADRLAQMIHFSTVVLLALAVYAFARRFLKNRMAGLLAVLIMLASPKVTLIGGWAFTDIAFVYFASLTFYAFVMWWSKDSFNWLLLAGLLCGFGFSLKYYGLRPPLVLGLALLWRDIQTGHNWRRILTDALAFGGTALVVAAPWYIKNWFWLDNPFYPFFLGGVNWNEFRAEEWARWVETFGRGYSLTDYLLLPVNVWLYPSDFSATPHGYFNLGFLLAIVALLGRPPSLLLGLWLYVVAQFYLWAAMMQELRYLLLVLPWLSLCAGWTLARLFDLSRGHRWYAALVRITPLFLVAPTLAVHIGVLTPLSKNPLPTVLGLESPASYLRRANYIYASMEFINAKLPGEARVIYLWEGQTYYCQRDCLADPIYDRWGDWVNRSQSIDGLLHRVEDVGATHILINHHDGLKPLLRNRSSAGPRARNIANFHLFRDKYLTQRYADQFIEIYQINYPVSSAEGAQ